MFSNADFPNPTSHSTPSTIGFVVDVQEEPSYQNPLKDVDAEVIIERFGSTIVDKVTESTPVQPGPDTRSEVKGLWALPAAISNFGSGARKMVRSYEDRGTSVSFL